MEQALRQADQRHAGQARAALDERAAGLCAEQGRRRASDLRLAVEAGGEKAGEQELRRRRGSVHASACSRRSAELKSTENPMNRQTWMWMQASVALMANAA